jgi:nicotinate-nucleotide--dimethylbenzimidazole phosphoribosyltransferase
MSTLSSTPKDGRPFDDMRALIASSPVADAAAREAVQLALAEIAGPKHPMGRFLDDLIWLAGWQKRPVPMIARPLVAIFSGAHDVAAAYTDSNIIEAAKKRVSDMTGGAASARGVAAAHNMAYKVYEMGLEYPAADFTHRPSLSERDCAAAMAFGMEVVAEGADIIALGNVGFGSVTAAAAIALALYGGAADYWAKGDDIKAAARIDCVRTGYQKFKGDIDGPLDALRHFGGRDIAGLVGAIIAARHQSIPVVLDGFVVTAAAAVLHSVNPDAVDHCIAGHMSAEPAHAALLERMGMTPLLGLGLGWGDGFGASLAVTLLQTAAAGYKTLTTS